MRLHCCERRLAHTPFSHDALDCSIPGRFALQAEQHGDCVAVRDRGRSITYVELDIWSNGVAAALLEELGEGSEPVPLLHRQGATSIAATLGVLKAGKFYVPLDPAEPSTRLRRAAEDVRARLVVTDQESRDFAEDVGLPLLLVDGLSTERAPGQEVSATAVAYVYFTSGSTGRPKGVYDSHRNVLHNILRYTNALEIAPADRLTLLQPPSFSGVVSSLFSALLNGATSCTYQLREDGIAGLGEWVTREEITIYHSVPSIFRTVVATGGAFPHVRVVRLEGDRAAALDVELFERHFAPGCILANGLGTTETGLARQLLVRHGDEVESGILPIGHPVRDVEVVILDEHGAELPPGDPGEIGVRSDYLALGYWNEPDLTSQSFLPPADGDTRRLYRTGDVGRLRADGCLEFLGRVDFELKVLGNRVDLAEVEAELVRLPEVADAVAATVPGRRGEGRLVAYVVPAGSAELDQNAMRDELGDRLPSYLIPSAYVPLVELPAGTNGKIDRRLLPVPPASTGPTKAASDLELEIAEIWADVLEVEVGPDDDFFDLGGDSLAAAEIVAIAEQTLRRQVPMTTLLAARTAREFAQAVERAGSLDGGSALVPLSDSGKGSPLFLVHGDRAHPTLYAKLARALESERAVWAVEPARGASSSSVEALAAQHVSAVGKRQPSGPYFFAGYCSYGVVAFEMARQLTALGEDVGLLVLMGISPADLPGLLSAGGLKRWRSLPRTIRYHLDEARRLPPRQAFSYLGVRGRRLPRRLVSQQAQPGARPQGLPRAVAEYAATPASTRLLLILEGDTTSRYTDSPATDWRALTTGPLAVHVIPGPHHVVLEDAAATAAAAQLILAASAAALQTLP